MKYFLSLLMVCFGCAYGQQTMYGNAKTDINGFWYYWVNAGDTIAKIKGDSVVFYKPVSLRGTVVFSQTATGSATNTTTETSLTSTGVGSLTIPVAKMTPGKSYRVSARGLLSTDPGSASTFNYRLKMGGTTIATTGNIFIGTNVSNRAWVIDAIITIRTNGASGTVMTFGMYEDGNSSHNPLNNGSSTTTIDMTTDKAIDLTVQMGSAAAAITSGAYILTLEEIN